MKKYNFVYSKLIYVLLTAVILLSMGAVIWNVYNLTAYFGNVGAYGVGNIAIAFVAVAVGLVVLTVAVSIVFNGKYVLDKDNITLRLGIISNKIKVSSVTGITHFKKSGKLVIYMEKNRYTVIVISPAEYDSFTDELLKLNPNIEYTSDSESNDDNG